MSSFANANCRLPFRAVLLGLAVTLVAPLGARAQEPVEAPEVPGMGTFSLFADPEGRELGLRKEAPKDEEEEEEE